MNILERAIRSNPNTSEIHYERSILGDIYHCGHDCTQPGRLMPSYSDPNIFSSGGSFSPPRSPLASIEVQRESSDSGLPGTPQPEELSSIGIPSPTSSNKSYPFRSPRHQAQHQTSPPENYQERAPAIRRRESNEAPSLQQQSVEVLSSPPYSTIKTLANVPLKQTSPNHRHVQYAVINHDAPIKLVRPAEYVQERYQTSASVPYATVNTVTDNTTPELPRERRNNYNKLRVLEEPRDDVIYDVPNCEDFTDPFSPSSAPIRSFMDTSANVKSPNYRPSSTSPKHIAYKASPTASGIRSPTSGPLYTPGTDLQDREEDYEDAWVPPIPKHKLKGQKQSWMEPPAVKPKRNRIHHETGSRRRFQSSSDVLDASTTTSSDARRGRMNENAVTTRTRTQSMASNGCDRQLEKTSNDFLKRLNEEEEKLTKVLAASRKEKNEELGEEERGDLNRPYMFNMDDLDHDYADPDKILETCSNLVDYHTAQSQPSYLPNRMLTKEPTNNIKGYAYKVQIPFANTQYDVPRRAAAAPDLRTMSHNAPPKPKRHISTEHLYFIK